MRRIISLALLVLTVTAGSAMADHGRSRDHRDGHRNWEHRQAPVVVRDHRYSNHYDNVRVQPSRRVYDRSYDRRRPVYASNGRFVFNGGVSYNYRRPVINYRYTDYRYRPQILVENYSPVSGYIWTAGQWQWNGYEWAWIGGHYDIDPSYQYSSYDDGSYNNDSYYQSPVSNEPCD
jgi:hypothetical protein